MKAKQIVNIFAYPDTRTLYEGRGILQEKTFENQDVEFWLVKLLRTGKIEQRVFYKRKLNSP